MNSLAALATKVRTEKLVLLTLAAFALLTTLQVGCSSGDKYDSGIGEDRTGARHGYGY